MILKTDGQFILGMSQQADGQMIEYRAPEEARANRQKYFANVGIDPQSVVTARLVHGNVVNVVRASDRGSEQQACDGLVTRDADTCLSITISDCLPVFFYDHIASVCGIAHAGWRGVVGNISGNLIQKMQEQGCDTKNIHVFIGPHIKACHFEIQSDILEHFLPYPSAIIHRDEKIFINLTAIVTEQLAACGVLPGHITEHQDCTFCNPTYFSYRRGDTPSQVGYILLKG
jgi:YfiH family protein